MWIAMKQGIVFRFFFFKQKTAYEMVKGVLPFTGLDVDSVMEAIAYGQADLVGLGPLESVIGRLLARRPEVRFASAREAMRGLQPLLGGFDVAEPRPVRESFLQ